MKQLIGTQLKRFLRHYRRQHPPQVRLTAVLQSVAYPANVGSIFRLADGAGFQELVLTGITPRPPQATLDKVARGKTRHVPWRYAEDAVDAVNSLKAAGYQVVALELTETALPYHTYAYQPQTCLVVGNEDHGITRATLEACDAAVFLPMYGRGLSLNVHVALGIVAYHLLHQIPSVQSASDKAEARGGGQAHPQA